MPAVSASAISKGLGHRGYWRGHAARGRATRGRNGCGGAMVPGAPAGPDEVGAAVEHLGLEVGIESLIRRQEFVGVPVRQGGGVSST